jgi:hypothetical protein
MLPKIISEPIEVAFVNNQPTQVKHDLGVVPSGFMVINKNAPADIYQSETLTRTILTLTATADCTAMLLLIS